MRLLLTCSMATVLTLSSGSLALGADPGELRERDAGLRPGGGRFPTAIAAAQLTWLTAFDPATRSAGVVDRRTGRFQVFEASAPAVD